MNLPLVHMQNLFEVITYLFLQANMKEGGRYIKSLLIVKGRKIIN